MQAFVDRSASIEAMWVVNGRRTFAYTSAGVEQDRPAIDVLY